MKPNKVAFGLNTILLALTLLVFPQLALSAGYSNEVEVPWNKVTAQFVNLTIFITIVAFLTRKQIAGYFRSRYESYHDLVHRAEQSRREAEKIRTEIRERLERLEASAQDSIETARREAKELSQKIEQEAQDLTAKLRTEAEKTAFFELERAKSELREELLELSLQAAHQALSESVNGTEQKRLQDEFVNKIQVVS